MFFLIFTPEVFSGAAAIRRPWWGPGAVGSTHFGASRDLAQKAVGLMGSGRC